MKSDASRWIMHLDMDAFYAAIEQRDDPALRRLPPNWINLPHRAYWLSPARRESTITRMSRRLWAFGTALFLFLLAVGLLTLKANLGDPVRLDEPVFLVALSLFLLYTLYWTLALYRAFRLPKDRHA